MTDHTALATKILSQLGFCTGESMERGVDTRRDKIVEMLEAATAQSQQRIAELEANAMDLARIHGEGFANSVTPLLKEVSELRAQLAASNEKLAAQQAAFHVNMLRAWPEKSHDEIAAAIDKVMPCGELTAIKAAEYERGYAESQERYQYDDEDMQACHEKAYKLGKQAGRAEAEKAAMEQECIGRVVHGSVILNCDTPPEGAIYTKPFSQQKPLSEVQLETLLYAVERKFPNETRYETALRYIRQVESGAACKSEASHGITGDKNAN